MLLRYSSLEIIRSVSFFPILFCAKRFCFSLSVVFFAGAFGIFADKLGGARGIFSERPCCSVNFFSRGDSAIISFTLPLAAFAFACSVFSPGIWLFFLNSREKRPAFFPL